MRSDTADLERKVNELAELVRELGPIALTREVARTGSAALDDAISMFSDGISVEDAWRHLSRCLAAERARREHEFVLLETAFDLIVVGERPSYVRFTLGSVAGSS